MPMYGKSGSGRVAGKGPNKGPKMKGGPMGGKTTPTVVAKKPAAPSTPTRSNPFPAPARSGGTDVAPKATPQTATARLTSMPSGSMGKPRVNAKGKGTGMKSSGHYGYLPWNKR